MKKSILGLLLAVALVVPAFAQKGDMSINGKLGLGLNNYGKVTKIMMEDDTIATSSKFNMPLSLTAEFFYEVIDNLSVGVGGTYSFNSNSKFELEGYKIEAGTTNLYLAVKPEAKLDSEIFTSLYLIGQVGVSMVRIDGDLFKSMTGENLDPKAGIYLGFGAGTIIANQVIVELLCSSANGKFDIGEMTDNSVQYTAVTLNVGYKFAL